MQLLNFIISKFISIDQTPIRKVDKGCGES